MTKKSLIIGYGYTGKYLSTMLIEHNIVVSATTRSPVKIKQWGGAPVRLILLDSKKLTINIANYDYILISVPPNPDGTDPIINSLKDQLIEE